MVPATGERERSFMKKKTNKPHGKLSKVTDFLPAPDQLLKSDLTRKVTIALDESTIEFFKKHAKKNDLKYQQMIREVLKIYATKFDKAS